MLKRAFALERGGQNRLEISWSGAWKDVLVTLDGAPVGSFETKRQLETGGTFTLPDGSQLLIKLERKGMDANLRVLRDSVPLRRGAISPAGRIALAAGVLYFIAALNFVLGLIADVGEVRSLQVMGVGFASIIASFVYAGLAYGAHAKRSLFALVLASVLLVVDGVDWWISLTGEEASLMVGLILRGLLLLPILRAVPTLNALTRKPSVPSWTDRRAIARQQHQSGLESTPTPADPSRWARRLKVTLVAIAVFASVGVAIVRFAPRTHAATLVHCEQAASVDETDRCLKGAAVRDGDSSFCKAMRRYEHFVPCSAGMEALLSDGMKCQRIEASVRRDECIANLVGSGSDPYLCELLDAGPSRQRCILNAGARWPPHP